MGVSIEELKEGCCKDLDKYRDKIILTDKNRKDKNIKFVDYVLEFENRYLFIEEKSFILAILTPKNNEISGGTIERFKALTPIEKDLKLCKAILRLTSDSNIKLKSTTIYMIKNSFSLEKIEKSSFIYLYCKSNIKAIDGLLSTFLSMKNRKNIFISCDKFKEFIEKKCI